MNTFSWVLWLSLKKFKEKAMKQTILFILLAVGLMVSACESKQVTTKTYILVDIPFCSSEQKNDSFDFKGKYQYIIKTYGNHLWGLISGDPDQSLNTVRGASKPDDILFALVSCSSNNASENQEGMDQFTETNVPKVCSDQKVIVVKRLVAEKSKRASALGYDGIVRFPKVDLACKKGKMLQTNNYSLFQILSDFMVSLKAYTKKYNKLPKSFEVLQKETLANPLPKDPWGNRFHYLLKDHRFMLISLGPDKKSGTKDDLELIKGQINSWSTSHTAFKKSGYDGFGDYKGFLKSRGID